MVHREGSEITANRMEEGDGKSTRGRKNTSPSPSASFHLQQVTIRGGKENFILNQVQSMICYKGLDFYIIDWRSLYYLGDQKTCLIFHSDVREEQSLCSRFKGTAGEGGRV